MPIIEREAGRYQATTTLPKLPVWEVPASIDVELQLSQFSNGSYFEKNKKPIKLFYEPAPSATYTTGQIDYSDDWRRFDVDKGDSYLKTAEII